MIDALVLLTNGVKFFFIFISIFTRQFLKYIIINSVCLFILINFASEQAKQRICTVPSHIKWILTWNFSSHSYKTTDCGHGR